LTAQAAVRSIAKVADAYKAAKVNGHKLEEPVRFRKHAAQRYDDRIFRLLPGVDQVSIWTLTGRIKLSFVYGEKGATQPSCGMVLRSASPIYGIQGGAEGNPGCRY
jgi:hypothetical protein